MEWDFIWKSVLIVIAGTFLLRMAGRKTLSQMTLAETVIMIAIGSLLIQPVAGKNLWTTFLVGGVLVGTLFVLEFVQVKSDSLEKLITGKAKILISKGTINERNLKKLRLTVDQLEMQLRQKNVTKISDVEYATLEANGQLGYVLKEEAQPVSKKEFQQLVNLLTKTNQQMDEIYRTMQQQDSMATKVNQENLFVEVQEKGHRSSPPKHLQ